MGKVRGFLLLFATLLLFWVMLMDSLAPDVLIVGALASLFTFITDANRELDEGGSDVAALDRARAASHHM